MKRILLSLLILVLLTGCISEKTVEPTQNNTKTSLNDGSPTDGDVVSINYIMRVEGELVDTTYEDLANSSEASREIKLQHPFGFEPLTFIVGSGHVNPELNRGVKNLEVGEKGTLLIPPESFMGPRNEGMVRVMPRFTSVPKEEILPRDFFETTYNTTAEVGVKIPFPYWNSTLSEVNEANVTLSHEPANDSIVPVRGGNVTMTYNETTITLEFTPLINVTFSPPEGGFVTIISANKTHLIADYNHPLAGKNLETELTLLENKGPFQWREDLDRAIDQSTQTNTPILILFTNSSCVTCRRIEFETLTHPFTLGLIDKYIWIKIDTETNRKKADKYGATQLPLLIILKDGKETRRITEFMPPDQIRIELESALTLPTT